VYDRYTIFSSQEELTKFFGPLEVSEWAPIYNAAPTNNLPVITSESPKMVQFFHWGLPQEIAKNKAVSPKLLNLKADSALNRPLYKKLLDTNRCVIPSNGFYLWKQIGKKKKTPYFCYFDQFKPFAFAGIWEKYEDLDGNSSFTFIMLVTDSSGQLTGYQDDMPLILNKSQIDIWLSKESSIESLQVILQSSEAANISLHAVNPRIVDTNTNDSSLIQAVPPSDQFGNYTLFS